MKRLIAILVLAAALVALYVAAGLPSRADVRALARTNPATTGVMRQREDEARRAGRPVHHVQKWVPIARVSRSLIQAVIAAEDQKFFGHDGIDWDAIQKSVEVNRQRGRFVRGGSTITQQLAKNLFLTTHKTLTRKLREFVIAYWLEQDLTKKRILELYLNVIEWGDGVYGCEAAAERYYGKSAAVLEPEEAAGLVAMIPNPRRINPLVDPRRHARAQRRVLWLMAHAGYIARTVAGLGATPPPPEPIEEDEAPLEEAPAMIASSAPPSAIAPSEPPASPSPIGSPIIESSPEPAPTSPSP